MKIMRIISLIACMALLVLASPLSTKAEVFVWNDPESAMSLSYPDHWLRQAQLSPGQKLVISHPQYQDFAHCTLHKRQKTDPLLNAQVMLDEMIVRGLDGVSIMKHRANAAWANRTATISEIGFSHDYNGKAYPMRAVSYATIMNQQLYTLTCAAYAPRFENHQTLFASVAASVRSRITATPFVNGHYRPFIHEHVYLFVDPNRRAVARF